MAILLILEFNSVGVISGLQTPAGAAAPGKLPGFFLFLSAILKADFTFTFSPFIPVKPLFQALLGLLTGRPTRLDLHRGCPWNTED